jgi:HAMP domain-containing protein
MIVICEECGKKYRIDPGKIKGKAASFKCRACAHLILVSKPEVSAPAGATLPVGETGKRATLESITTTADDESAASISGMETAGGDSGDMISQLQRKAGRLGLRAKMLMLFLLVPMIFMVAASLFYLWQFENTTSLLTHESTKFINRMAEEKIHDQSVAVAMQCKLYLLSHPELKKETFSKDLGFKSLAVQKVGLTGYTALYQLPGSDGVWRTWAHVNPKIVGIDMSTLRKPLGKSFDGFWKVYTGVKGGKKSQGYYSWKDKDGKFRDKFMVCTPIAGTRFVIAATTYLDEFTGPVRMMETNAAAFTQRARKITYVILGATLLLIGLIVSLYGHRLTGKIKSLTEVADRISVGELGMDIKTKSKDEIGDLAEAIARMQDSIRLSIERLRRRR